MRATTEAGRALSRWLNMTSEGEPYSAEALDARIVAIEAEARATAESEIERLKAGLADCAEALRSSVGNTDVAIQALGEKVPA